MLLIAWTEFFCSAVGKGLFFLLKDEEAYLRVWSRQQNILTVNVVSSGDKLGHMEMSPAAKKTDHSTLLCLLHDLILNQQGWPYTGKFEKDK